MSGRNHPAPVGTTNPAFADGRPCQWCGRAATALITVRPARVVKNEIVEQSITALACAEHASLPNDPSPPPGAIRRKHAKGFEHASLLDPPSADAPSNAIYGDAV